MNNEQSDSSEEELIKVNLAKVYCLAPHAFTYGCGRETMMFWWHKYTGFYFKKSLIRKVINDYCRNRYQNELGYWCFEM